jgi:diphthamide synthase subunit DPH2
MQKIIICGSMSHIASMKNIASQLKSMGYTPILPKEDDWNNITPDQINAYKKSVSMRHFSEIAADDTHAIFVVNEEKNDTPHYIGANSFAEIAIAFYFGKKIFLLNSAYKPYEDELSAWGAVALHGKINDIRQH